MLSPALVRKARSGAALLNANVRRVRLVQRTFLARLIKFLVVGAAGAVVNTVALFLLYQVARLPLVAASALSVELAIINGFVWNDRWTFKRSALSLRRFVRFHTVSLGGLVITTATLWVLVRYAGVHYLAANGVGIILATMWNFQANRLWTWKEGGRASRG